MRRAAGTTGRRAMFSFQKNTSVLDFSGKYFSNTFFLKTLFFGMKKSEIIFFDIKSGVKLNFSFKKLENKKVYFVFFLSALFIFYVVSINNLNKNTYANTRFARSRA